LGAEEFGDWEVPTSPLSEQAIEKLTTYHSNTTNSKKSKSFYVASDVVAVVGCFALPVLRQPSRISALGQNREELGHSQITACRRQSTESSVEKKDASDREYSRKP